MSRRRVHHALILVRRAGAHVHPWLPTCACGWQGIPGRRPFAVALYRSHSRPRREPPAPRPLTPVEDLPEELR